MERGAAATGNHVNNAILLGSIIQVLMAGQNEHNAVFHEELMESVSIRRMPVKPITCPDGRWKNRPVHNNEFAFEVSGEFLLRPVKLLARDLPYLPRHLGIEENKERVAAGNTVEGLFAKNFCVGCQGAFGIDVVIPRRYIQCDLISGDPQKFLPLLLSPGRVNGVPYMDHHLYTILFHLLDEGGISSFCPAYPRISDDGEGTIVGSTARGGDDSEQDQQEYRVSRSSFHSVDATQLTAFPTATQP